MPATLALVVARQHLARWLADPLDATATARAAVWIVRLTPTEAAELAHRQPFLVRLIGACVGQPFEVAHRTLVAAGDHLARIRATLPEPYGPPAVGPPQALDGR